jgi:hypothetical protein
VGQGAAGGGGQVGTLAPAVEASGSRKTTGIPQRDTMIKMMKPITAEFKETRLEEVAKFIQSVSDADIDFLWLDDSNSDGLDKDALITAKATNQSILRVLEIVLEKASAQGFSAGGGNTWQMSDTGAMQVGPRGRLNKYKRVEIYPIGDLLSETPDYPNAPEFDLQQALQARTRGGGGGGQAPFQDADEDERERRSVQEKADEMIELLTSLVEPEQWKESGGDGGSMRYFQGTLIVNAPDYMHRGLNGYPWWPATGTKRVTQNGRRWVSLGMDSATSQLLGIENFPVTAVVPGQGLVRPGGGG